jgi:hypothetical protein
MRSKLTAYGINSTPNEPAQTFSFHRGANGPDLRFGGRAAGRKPRLFSFRMTKTRKIRADAKLLKLPQSQQQQLKEWLIAENISYEDAVVRLGKHFGVKTHFSAIGRFWDQVCSPAILRGEWSNPPPGGFSPSRAANPALELVLTFESPNSIRLKIFPAVGARIKT